MELENNSHRAREASRKPNEALPEKKNTKVTMGKVVKKRNPLRKFSESFLADDLNNIFYHVVHEIIRPAIINTAVDAVENTVEMALLGERRERTGRSRRTAADSVSYRYDKCYDDRDRRNESRRSVSRPVYDYGDIEVETEYEAKNVLKRLDDIIRQYGFASVADLYESVGEVPAHTDHDYGWRNIDDAQIIRTRFGYKLRMPRLRPYE